MGRVVWFELPADDLERAKDFYGKVFGWPAEAWQGPAEYLMLTTGKGEPGIDGALTRRSAVRQGIIPCRVRAVTGKPRGGRQPWADRRRS